MQNQTNAENSTENIVAEDDKNLMAIAQYLKDAQFGHKKTIAPLNQWQPKHCGTMDLSIKANGEWWHQGQLIQRQNLIELFSRVLCKENDQFYLKTPVEKIKIHVEDEALFVNQIDRVEIDGRFYIQCTTSTQDIIIVNTDHPIFMRAFAGEMRPYVYVRFGLNALIQRAAFYHLIAMGELVENDQGESIFQLQSGDLLLQLQS